MTEDASGHVSFVNHIQWMGPMAFSFIAAIVSISFIYSGQSTAINDRMIALERRADMTDASILRVNKSLNYLVMQECFRDTNRGTSSACSGNMGN